MNQTKIINPIKAIGPATNISNLIQKEEIEGNSVSKQSIENSSDERSATGWATLNT